MRRATPTVPCSSSIAPSRPIPTGPWSCSARRRRTASSGGCSRSGADDIVMLPQSPEQVQFDAAEGIARARAVPRAGSPTRAADRRARAEGRHREDARQREPRGGARPAWQRTCRSSTSTSSSGTSASASGSRPSGRCTTSHSPAARSTLEKLDAYLVMHSSGVRALLAPKRPDQAGDDHGRCLRDVYAALRSEFDYVDRRHAARLHARGDRHDRRLDRPRAWSGCSTRCRSRTPSSASRRSI